MASFTSFLLFLSLLTTAFFFSPYQTLARESQFSFSKTTRPNIPAENTPLNKQEPAQDAAATDPTQSNHGYGLYGRSPQQLLPTDTTTTSFSSSQSNHNGALYNPDGRSNLGTLNSYSNGQYYTHGGTPESEVAGGGYKNNMQYAKSELGSKQYGMSDTRMMENGKYFYDVDAGSNNSPKEYYGSGGVAGSENYGYKVHYMNNRDRTHGVTEYGGYKNFMDENQNGQEMQEEYVP